ncbi:MAG: MetQ/NlpA family ABC transporter substrate-binding protein [Erysipelotrichaceae bacterium]
MKKLISILTVLFILVGCSSTTTNKVIKIGVVGDDKILWEPAKQQLLKEGIEIEIIEFADYSQPNRQLNDKQIDLNAFQHKAYLAKEIEEHKYNLSILGDTIASPLGLFSKKYKNINEFKTNDTIVIPNDATNSGRALKVLEAAKLLSVDASKGYLPTIKDITSNPLNLKIIELDASQTALQLDDPKVAAAIINGGHAVDHNLSPKNDSIYLETIEVGGNNPYINILVCRKDDINNEDYKKVLDAYQSSNTAKVLEDNYKGSYIPAWK